MNSIPVLGVGVTAEAGEVRAMHNRWDDRDHPRHEHARAREPEELVFTTLAVGEEGGDLEPEWSVATPLAIGEEGCPGLEEGFATTAAVGEEGDPGLDPWGA